MGRKGHRRWGRLVAVAVVWAFALAMAVGVAPAKAEAASGCIASAHCPHGMEHANKVVHGSACSVSGPCSLGCFVVGEALFVQRTGQAQKVTEQGGVVARDRVIAPALRPPRAGLA